MKIISFDGVCNLADWFTCFRFGRKDRSYSVKGIQICIEHFEKDGFNVKAVVPQMRYVF